MTIKLLTPRDLTIGGRTVTYPAGALVTLDAATETGLINSKEATATLTGGITYTPPVPSGQPVPLMVIPSAQGIGNPGAGAVATVGDVSIPLATPSALLIVGDSTEQYGLTPGVVWTPTGSLSLSGGLLAWYATAYVADSKGLSMTPLGMGPNITVTTASNLEYRAADKAVRWTAPGDAAGPWTPLILGVQMIESASAGMEFAFGLRSMLTLPSADQTIPVTNSATRWATRDMTSAIANALSRMRNGFRAIAMCGLGGTHIVEMSEMLTWYRKMMPGPGYIVDRSGVNSVARGDSAGTMIVHKKGQFDAWLAEGKRIVAIPVHARCGTSGPSSQLSAPQIAVAHAYNKWVRDYVAQHGWAMRYVDSYALSADPDYLDFRPAAGVTVDGLHDAETGLAVTLGAAIAAALQSLGAPVGNYTQLGDPTNLLPDGWLAGGSTGVVGAGATGQVATGWEVARVTGADATVACSVVARSDRAGNVQRMDFTATAAGQKIQFDTPYANRKTLAQIGKNVGDSFRIEADLSVSNLSGGGLSQATEIVVVFTGAASIRTVAKAPPIAGDYHLVTPDIPIPAGVTHVQTYMYAYPGANSTGRLEPSAVQIR